MVRQESLFVTLVKLVDGISMPVPPAQGRGRHPVFPNRLFLQVSVIMMVRRLHKMNAFLAVLAEPPPKRHGLRGLLANPQGRVLSRRTWEHRPCILHSAFSEAFVRHPP
jgi:hypothetical protein